MKRLLAIVALAAAMAAPAAASNFIFSAPMTCTGSACALDPSVSPPATDYQLTLPFSCASGTCATSTWGVTPPVGVTYVGTSFVGSASGSGPLSLSPPAGVVPGSLLL